MGGGHILAGEHKVRPYVFMIDKGVGPYVMIAMASPCIIRYVDLILGEHKVCPYVIAVIITTQVALDFGAYFRRQGCQVFI